MIGIVAHVRRSEKRLPIAAPLGIMFCTQVYSKGSGKRDG
jgi:hypothetical protein